DADRAVALATTVVHADGAGADPLDRLVLAVALFLRGRLDGDTTGSGGDFDTAGGDPSAALGSAALAPSAPRALRRGPAPPPRAGHPLRAALDDALGAERPHEHPPWTNAPRADPLAGERPAAVAAALSAVGAEGLLCIAPSAGSTADAVLVYAADATVHRIGTVEPPDRVGYDGVPRWTPSTWKTVVEPLLSRLPPQVGRPPVLGQ